MGLAKMAKDGVLTVTGLEQLPPDFLGTLDLTLQLDLKKLDKENVEQVEACWQELKEGWGPIFRDHLCQERAQMQLLSTEPEASPASSYPTAPDTAAEIASRCFPAENWALAVFALQYICHPLLDFIAVCKCRATVEALNGEQRSRLNHVATCLGTVAEDSSAGARPISAVSPYLLVLLFGTEFAKHREGQEATRRWLSHYISLSASQSATPEPSHATSASPVLPTPCSASMNNRSAVRAEQLKRQRLQPLQSLLSELCRHAIALAASHQDSSRRTTYQTVVREAFRSLARERTGDENAFYGFKAPPTTANDALVKTPTLAKPKPVISKPLSPSKAAPAPSKPTNTPKKKRGRPRKLDLEQRKKKAEDENIAQGNEDTHTSTLDQVVVDQDNAPLATGSLQLRSLQEQETTMEDASILLLAVENEKFLDKGQEEENAASDAIVVQTHNDRSNMHENGQEEAQHGKGNSEWPPAAAASNDGGGDGIATDPQASPTEEMVTAGESVEPSQDHGPEEQYQDYNIAAYPEDEDNAHIDGMDDWGDMLCLSPDANSTSLPRPNTPTPESRTPPLAALGKSVVPTLKEQKPTSSKTSCSGGESASAKVAIVPKESRYPARWSLSKCVAAQPLPKKKDHQTSLEPSNQDIPPSLLTNTPNKAQIPALKRRKINREDSKSGVLSIFLGETGMSVDKPVSRKRPIAGLTTSRFSSEILSNSLARLNDMDGWLDDVLVNFCIAHLCYQTRHLHRSFKVGMIDSLVVATDPQAISDTQFAKFQTTIRDAAVTLFPLFNPHRHHWLLACWQSQQRRLDVSDSLALPPPERPSNRQDESPIYRVLDWLRKVYGQEVTDSCVVYVKCPQQETGNDCGVFVIAFARAICRGQPVSEIEDVGQLRRHLRHFLFIPSPFDSRCAMDAGERPAFSYSPRVCGEYLKRSAIIDSTIERRVINCRGEQPNNNTNIPQGGINTEQDKRKFLEFLHAANCEWYKVSTLFATQHALTRHPLFDQRELGLVMPRMLDFTITKVQVDTLRASVTTMALQYGAMLFRHQYHRALDSVLQLARCYHEIKNITSVRKREAEKLYLVLSRPAGLENDEDARRQSYQGEAGNLNGDGTMALNGDSKRSKELPVSGAQEAAHALRGVEGQLQASLGNYLRTIDEQMAKYGPTRQEIRHGWWRCAVLIVLARVTDDRWAKEAQFL